MFPVQQESTTNLRHFEVSFPPVHRVHRRKKNIKIWWVEFNEVLYNLHAHSLPTFSHRLFSCFQLNQLAFGVSLIQVILSYFATTSMSQSYQSLKWFFSLLLSFQLNWCDPHPPLDVSREPYTVAPPTLAFQGKNVTPMFRLAVCVKVTAEWGDSLWSTNGGIYRVATEARRPLCKWKSVCWSDFVHRLIT